MELVDLIDALDNLLVAPLVALNVQVIPNHQLPVEARVEDLGLKGVPHVHHLSDQLELISLRILGGHHKNLHGFVSNSLPHESPVLVILLLSTSCFLEVERHDPLRDPDEVIDVLLHLSYESGEEVSPGVSPALVVRFAVIEFFEDVDLLLHI